MLEQIVDMHPEASRFAWVVDGRVRGPSDVFDVPMYVDQDSVVLPSVGSMVPGWTLVVPRQSARNFACLDGDRRRALGPALDFAARFIAGFDCGIFEFEHGAAYFGSPTGCGVDHAHLHIVPLPFDLVRAVETVHGGQSFGSEVDDPWALIDRDQDYWVVRNRQSGAGVIVYPPEPVSQGIRRVIANELGLATWDYRQFKFEENAIKTRRAATEPAGRAG